MSPRFACSIHMHSRSDGAKTYSCMCCKHRVVRQAWLRERPGHETSSLLKCLPCS